MRFIIWDCLPIIRHRAIWYSLLSLFNLFWYVGNNEAVANTYSKTKYAKIWYVHNIMHNPRHYIVEIQADEVTPCYHVASFVIHWLIIQSIPAPWNIKGIQSYWTVETSGTDACTLYNVTFINVGFWRWRRRRFNNCAFYEMPIIAYPYFLDIF